MYGSGRIDRRGTVYAPASREGLRDAALDPEDEEDEEEELEDEEALREADLRLGASGERERRLRRRSSSGLRRRSSLCSRAVEKVMSHHVGRADRASSEPRFVGIDDTHSCTCD